MKTALSIIFLTIAIICTGCGTSQTGTRNAQDDFRPGDPQYKNPGLPETSRRRQYQRYQQDQRLIERMNREIQQYAKDIQR